MAPRFASLETGELMSGRARDLFPSRLHMQIVVPLLAATMIVGLAATAVGVGVLISITDQWTASAAEAQISAAEHRLDDAGERIAMQARWIAEDDGIRGAWTARDDTAIAAHLVTMHPASDADSVMLLDADGAVVRGSGGLSPEAGDIPFPEDAEVWAPLGVSYVTFAEVDGIPTITAFHTVRNNDGEHGRVAVSIELDEGFVGGLSDEAGAALCISDASGQCVAATAASDEDGAPDVAAAVGDNRILAAMARDDEQVMSLDIGGQDHRAAIRQVAFETDPTEASAYLVGVTSAGMAAETRSTTVQVVAVWSLLAIAAISVLGWFIARRVTGPIVRMTETARQVADGDYTHEVEVPSHNEIGELAQTFNEMTASLRDRNDALTKKVLELATLYEMSRVLSGTLDLEPLLQAVLDSSMRIFDVGSGYVILRDPDTGELDLVAWRDTDSGPPTELELNSSIAEWVVREGRPLIFNPSTEPEGGYVVDSITGSTTALCVPLVSSDGPIGAVTVGSKDPSLRFSGDDVRLLSTIANHATIAIGNIELFSSLQEAYLATVRSLAAAVDAKDPYTRGHSDAVAEYALAVAAELELSPDQVRTLEMAAYLHDIGKIGVKESILLKPGALTSDEMAQMRHHPLIGASILRPVVFPWPVAPIIRHHHEWWDGSGYPAGLAGEEIPLLARILTVADAYEAMTADRPYRSGRDAASAKAELRDFAGRQFDPRVVEAFLAALEKQDWQTPELGRRAESGVQRDEARAAFSSLCDSMFDSFRRLAGPRLASNVDAQLAQRFDERGCPCTCNAGRIVVRWDDSRSPDEELDEMQRVMAIVSEEMERSAGISLVEQFYREAVGGMSARLRRAAVGLPLRD